MDALPRAWTTVFACAVVFAALTIGYRLRGPSDAAAPVRPGRDTAGPSGGDAAGVGFGPAPDAGGRTRLPGEFEPVDAIMLGVNELLDHHPDTLVRLLTALADDTDVIALVSHPDQEPRTLELLRAHGVPADRLRFFLWPAEGMWVQDFGPQQVLGDDVRLVDFEYSVPGRERDNQLPMAFAATFGMKIDHCHLLMEGGSLLSNGCGLCITSTRIIEQNAPRGLDLHAIGDILKRKFGFDQWAYVQPLVGEPTGHADMFLSVAGPGTVVVAAYDPDAEPANARRMDEAAALLTNGFTVDGRPIEVVRVRQPAARDGHWRSYTNVIYGNGVVIVPQFPDVCPDLDREALELYRRVCPSRRVVGVDASSIVAKRGGFHCLSRSIPRLPRPVSASPAGSP